MFTSQSILEGDNLPKVRVGIGRGTDKGNVERSVHAIGSKDITIYDDPHALVNDLMSGRIDAAVRGDMSSSKLLPMLKSATGVKNLERLVLLEPKRGKLVFMAPVGIDEGWTVKQKYDIVERSIKLMGRLGAGQRVAIMSGGRNEDIGRCAAVDKTIHDANELVGLLKRQGYDAYNCQILIEDAIEEADLIIAPDGISGNIIFRVIHFIGEAKALGAPVINIDEVFVDTSREKTDYTDSIQLAMRLKGEYQ